MKAIDSFFITVTKELDKLNIIDRNKALLSLKEEFDAELLKLKNRYSEIEYGESVDVIDTHNRGFSRRPY